MNQNTSSIDAPDKQQVTEAEEYKQAGPSQQSQIFIDTTSQKHYEHPIYAPVELLGIPSPMRDDFYDEFG